jgi:hypothetical protein
VSTHRAEAADQADVPDGMSIPDELARREERLAKLAAARAKIEARVRSFGANCLPMAPLLQMAGGQHAVCLICCGVLRNNGASPVRISSLSAGNFDLRPGFEYTATFNHVVGLDD